MNTRPYPYSVSNPNGFGIASPSRPLIRIYGVIRRVDSYAWPEKHIVANENAATVQHYAIEICVEVIAYVYVLPKLTAKSRFKVNIQTNGAQQPAQNVFSLRSRL